MIETYRGVVYPNQLDHMEHMNVQWYTSKFDEGTWHLFSSVGLTSKYFRENNRGMAAVEQKIRYKAEALAGDLLVIESSIIEIKDKSIKFVHKMCNSESGAEIANSELVAVHFDRELRKACSLPDFIKENRFEDAIV
jgi:acyl-CoA thioester hydrolase